MSVHTPRRDLFADGINDSDERGCGGQDPQVLIFVESQITHLINKINREFANDCKFTIDFGLIVNLRRAPGATCRERDEEN